MSISGSIKWIFCSITLLLTYFSYGQNVTIKGEAKNAEGKTITLYAYADQLTFTEKKLVSALIDSAGKFTISLNTNETILAFVRIEYFSKEIYLVPGKEYKINIIPNLLKRKSPYLNGENISLDITSNGTNELNHIINTLRLECNDFILKNFETVFKNRNKSILDSFKTQIHTEYKDVDDIYFNNYIKYKLGSYYYSSKTKSEAEIEKLYFNSGPIQYDNSEYMGFFNDFFEKYYTRSKYIKQLELFEAVNTSRGSYESIKDILKKDTLLKSEDIRELLLLKAMNELYHAKGYNKENVLYIIREAEIKAKSSQNKAIATNLYKLLTKLAPYTKAPGFNLKDIDGKECSLKSLKGKYVYLSFFQTDNVSGVSEIKVLSSFYDKYKDKIEFVNICCDADLGTLQDFLKDYKGMKGKYLSFDNNWDLLNSYNIKSFPTFVFIDPEGEIINYPSVRPSEQVQTVFDKELQGK